MIRLAFNCAIIILVSQAITPHRVFAARETDSDSPSPPERDCLASASCSGLNQIVQRGRSAEKDPREDESLTSPESHSPTESENSKTDSPTAERSGGDSTSGQVNSSVIQGTGARGTESSGSPITCLESATCTDPSQPRADRISIPPTERKPANLVLQAGSEVTRETAAPGTDAGHDSAAAGEAPLRSNVSDGANQHDVNPSEDVLGHEVSNVGGESSETPVNQAPRWSAEESVIEGNEVSSLHDEKDSKGMPHEFNAETEEEMDDAAHLSKDTPSSAGQLSSTAVANKEVEVETDDIDTHGDEIRPEPEDADAHSQETLDPHHDYASPAPGQLPKDQLSGAVSSDRNMLGDDETRPESSTTKDPSGCSIGSSDICSADFTPESEMTVSGLVYGRHYGRLYHRISQYLVEKEETSLTERNMQVAIDWLESESLKENMMNRGLIGALRQFTALASIIPENRCSRTSYTILWRNNRATGGRLHKQTITQMIRRRRIDVLIHRYMLKHALECIHVYPRKYFELAHKMNQTALRFVTEFLDNPILVFGNKQLSPLDMDTDVLLLMDELDVITYRTLQDSRMIDDRDLCFLSKQVDSYGKQEVRVDRIEDLIDRYLVEPCRNYVRALGPDVFLPAGFDSDMLGNDINYDPKDTEISAYMRAWLRFKVCEKLITPREAINLATRVATIVTMYNTGTSL